MAVRSKLPARNSQDVKVSLARFDSRLGAENRKRRRCAQRWPRCLRPGFHLEKPPLPVSEFCRPINGSAAVPACIPMIGAPIAQRI